MTACPRFCVARKIARNVEAVRVPYPDRRGEFARMISSWSATGIMASIRNLRLTAIRSFFRYASFEMPTHAAQIQRVLAIPNKRCTRTQIGFLVREEIHALLNAPDRCTRSGRRGHALLLLAVQTGLRLSEITGLCRNAICLGTGAHVRVVGKGRKERATPLPKATADVLRVWLREIDDGAESLVFPSARGTRLSADGVHYLVSKHVTQACQACPSLAHKHVTPHVLRRNGTPTGGSRLFGDRVVARS